MTPLYLIIPSLLLSRVLIYVEALQNGPQPIKPLTAMVPRHELKELVGAKEGL